MTNQPPLTPPILSRQAIGWSAVFGSAFFFYLATVIIRWSAASVQIPSAYFVFARLLLGFVFVAATMVVQRQRPKPVKYPLLIGRALSNTIAVYCFYKAVELGSVAEANILNMTYPLFVAVFSWIFLRGQRDVLSLITVIVAFIGIWLVLAPDKMNPGWANLWGLSSGICAAAAIVILNVSRRYHDSQTILLFMFGLGAAVMLIFFHQAFFIPNGREMYFLLASSVSGVVGQYLITFGFLYVTAVEGSVISSSRILLAALFGPLLVADPALTLMGWCGALLIFAANVTLAMRKRRVV
ncbi:MAG: DMT family transporter [Desulfuromonadales bacterium]